MAKVKGICKNYGECGLADSKEIQEVEKTNFVCEECGKTLYEQNSPIKKAKTSKLPLLLLIAAGLVLLGGGGFAVTHWGGKDKVDTEEDGVKTPVAPPIVPVDSIIVSETEHTLYIGDSAKITTKVIPSEATDTTVVWMTSNPNIVTVSDGNIKAVGKGQATVTVKSNDGKASATVTVTVNVTPKEEGPSGYALGWGTYEGPMQGGKPHGIGGEVKVSKSYSIDLKNGSSKQVFRGDKLVNTKFLNGKLVQGYIHRSNGEQESFVIGN